MKLSRRCFLSLVVGGAAGTALSPLPWKLVDDASIWSQNWPWTPVPLDGAVSTVHSTCTLCPGGCGISVRKVDQRAVKIEGRQGHPLNNGGICMLGLSGLQLLYGPTRIREPLKRVGDRGQGSWQAISWDQAIREVATQFKTIRQKGNPQSVACLASKENGSVSQLLNRWLTAYGSPNFLRMPSVEDAYDAVLKLTHGRDGTVGLDVENADFILSFGSAILDGYGSPVQMIQAAARLKETHGMVVQIESRLSNTAAKADVWLAAKPGTEADLALSMAHVMIRQNRFNADFVTRNTDGFDDFARMVREKYAPESVAALTGIDAETITKIALQFAAAHKPLAIYGRGKGQTPGSLKQALAIHALNALVGNIHQAGGVGAVQPVDYIRWPDVAIDDIAAAGLKTARADGAGTPSLSNARYLTNRFIDAVNSGQADIQALLVADANPCYSLPNTAAVKSALEKIPFVVSFSSFMDETAACADLILPNHTYLERFEDVPVSALVSRPVVGLCQPVVAPLYNTRHLGTTILQLAQAMGGSVAGSFPWKDYEICLQETLNGQWDVLVENGYFTPGRQKASGWADGFGTASGKLVMMDSTLSAIYSTPENRLAGEELVLIAYDSIRLASGTIGDTPFMIKTVADTVLKGKDTLVEINPDTAARLGFEEGQSALLTTAVGKASVRLHLSNGIMPNLVAMVRGLGHTVRDPFLAGKGVNVNSLIGSVEDPASGLDAAWGIQARLAKA